MAKNKHQVNNKPKNIKGKKSFKGKKRNKFLFDTNARLVVRNLSFKTTEKSLKQHFETYGNVVHVELPKRPNGDLVGCGFVQYENIDGAKQGLESRNGQPFLGRSLQIDWAVSKEENRKLNSKNEIKDEMDIKMDIDSHNTTNDDNTVLDKLPNLNSNKKSFKKNQINNKEKEVENKTKIIRKARLIVRNISFKATEENFKKHFDPYGDIIEMTLLKKPNGYLVGCGFVQFKDVKMAMKAMLETNAKPFLGRPIHVDWAVAKNKYMAHLTEKADELEYLKNDVKSEPESEDDNIEKKVDIGCVEIKKESDDNDDNSDTDKSENSHDQDDDDDNSDNENAQENDFSLDNIKNEPMEFKTKVSANDAEDGNTVFLKNIAFSVTNDDLEGFAKQFGDIVYALVCVDKLTEHSKGSAFIRFKTKEDADIFLSSSPEKLMLHDQTIQPLPALLRDHAKKDRIKQPKDSRNLYLVKEGLILANTKSASGVSTSDMSKRLSLEQKKSQMLKNLNRFISRYRLTIHNIPLHYNDEDLRKICLEVTNAKPFCLKECRIMKHLKGPLDSNGKHISKGYGFVTFTKHEDALAWLRRMNNNPSIFDKNNRPIVSFSIEDKAVINARNKRLEKSQVKNPMHSHYKPETTDKDVSNSDSKKQLKKNHVSNKNFVSSKIDKKEKFKSKKMIENEFMGEVGMPGKPLKMRNRYKLKMQANMHKQNVKQEKKTKKSIQQKKKIGIKEKIRQPKQKQNTNPEKKLKNISQLRDDKNFSDLVNKYKSKLTGGSSMQKIKSKWYE